MGLGGYTPSAQGDTSTPRTSLLPPAPRTPMRTPGTPRAASRRSLRPIAAGQSDTAPRAARWGCWGDAALTWVTLGEGWHRPGGGGEVTLGGRGTHPRERGYAGCGTTREGVRENRSAGRGVPAGRGTDPWGGGVLLGVLGTSRDRAGGTRGSWNRPWRECCWRIAELPEGRLRAQDCADLPPLTCAWATTRLLLPSP